ncbi:MAG: ATP synthase F1 subunit delta [Chitinophagaceae bacterium]|nr:MAG: ATP synthase F1 subunit delta [Chitinophagaceae bacterium]
MNNPRLAGRYAKSLLNLAIEQNNLDAVWADIQLLKAISKSNPDVVNLLRSPVIGSDKKGKILAAILDGKLSALTNAFIQLLTRKSRESNLPEIVNAFTEQYNELKNIHIVKLTTASAISDELRDSIVAKIKADSGLDNIQIETSVKEELIGGFKLEMRGNLVDASILRDLNDVKKQFANNEYMHSIR